MKGIIKKLGYFAGICGWILGAVGGVGYACYNRAYLIAAAVAFLAVLSFPKVREFVEKLMASE